MAVSALFRRFRIPPNRRPDGRVEIELRAWVRVLRTVRDEIRTPFRLPWRTRLALLRRGFTSQAGVLYRLGERAPGAFISDFGFARRGYRINRFWNPIVGNKRIASQVLAAYGIPHARLLAAVVEGRLCGLQREEQRQGGDRLERMLSECEGLVFRPDWSGAGEGIFFLRREGPAYAVNGVAATLDECRHLVAALDRYVVTEFVPQAGYARTIFPASTNTLRVLTLWDEDGPFVAAVVHRFGSSRSLPVDNWQKGRGGVCAAVDREAGTLGRAVRLDAQLRLEWCTRHPETDAPIAGVRIPHLEAALDGMLRATRCFPGAACVGWDAVMTDDGFRILEANTTPGLFVWQVHAPLLDDDRTARFFARHGFTRPTPAGRPG